MLPNDPETFSWLRLILAFAVVTGLMAFLALGLKFLARRGFGIANVSSAAPNGRRLQVIESLNLDLKRRLVIIRQDQHEHLLLLGADHDIVVASYPLNESSKTPPLSPSPRSL